MSNLFITVNGRNVPVFVSENGIFYDLETKTYSAKTLAGLQRSMNAKMTPTGIPVQVKDGRLGKVIGRHGGRGWDKNHFTVVWANNATSTESGNALYPILTNEQKAEIAKLENEVTAAEESLRVERQALNDYLSSIKISAQLEAAFAPV